MCDGVIVAVAGLDGVYVDDGVSDGVAEGDDARSVTSRDDVRKRPSFVVVATTRTIREKMPSP